jgi:hypothetical protein
MEKVCSKCKQLLDLSLFSIDKYQKSGYRTACKKCSALEFKRYKSENPESYVRRLVNTKQKRFELKETNPIKVWAHTNYHNAKSRAKKLGLEFDLSKKWLEENAPTHCPLLGIELTYNAIKSEFNCASIDKVNSSKGYTRDNCKIISFKANRIKSDASIKELEILVRNLRNY